MCETQLAEDSGCLLLYLQVEQNLEAEGWQNQDSGSHLAGITFQISKLKLNGHIEPGTSVLFKKEGKKSSIEEMFIWGDRTSQ